MRYNLDLEKKRILANKSLKIAEKLDYMSCHYFELFLEEKAKEMSTFSNEKISTVKALTLINNANSLTVKEKVHFRDLVKAISILQIAHFANSVTLSDEQLKLDAMLLFDLDAQSVSEAILEIIQTQKYFPTISEIRETVQYISLCRVYDNADKFFSEFKEKEASKKKQASEKERRLMQEHDTYLQEMYKNHIIS